jgi:hypothetical protein
MHCDPPPAAESTFNMGTAVYASLKFIWAISAGHPCFSALAFGVHDLG